MQITQNLTSSVQICVRPMTALFKVISLTPDHLHASVACKKSKTFGPIPLVKDHLQQVAQGHVQAAFEDLRGEIFLLYLCIILKRGKKKPSANSMLCIFSLDCLWWVVHYALQFGLHLPPGARNEPLWSGTVSITACLWILWAGSMKQKQMTFWLVIVIAPHIVSCQWDLRAHKKDT